MFVLGAGFTKAFLPEAPLLVDHYDLTSLLPKYEHCDLAKAVIDGVLERSNNGKIDIERLLTRLDGLPYDRSDAALQLGLLNLDVHSLFIKRLRQAKSRSNVHKEDLKRFAKHCIDHNITCITFNYDDVFDQALWEENPVYRPLHNPHWTPDGGYGFFCRASASCVIDTPMFMDTTSPLLLKLHGSINWRIKRGAARPYSVDAIVHHEDWWKPQRREPVDMNSIELHLEPGEFLVPPVLAKTSLLEEPILKIVWDRAFHELLAADEVFFIGYSCPVTDLAMSLLLTEAFPSEHARVWVINKAENDDQARVKDAYRAVFPHITGGQFIFRDALEWARELVAKGEQEASSSEPG